MFLEMKRVREEKRTLTRRDLQRLVMTLIGCDFKQMTDVQKELAFSTLREANAHCARTGFASAAKWSKFDEKEIRRNLNMNLHTACNQWPKNNGNLLLSQEELDAIDWDNAPKCISDLRSAALPPSSVSTPSTPESTPSTPSTPFAWIIIKPRVRSAAPVAPAPVAAPVAPVPVAPVPVAPVPVAPVAPVVDSVEKRKQRLNAQIVKHLTALDDCLKRRFEADSAAAEQLLQLLL